MTEKQYIAKLRKGVKLLRAARATGDVIFGIDISIDVEETLARWKEDMTKQKIKKKLAREKARKKKTNMTINNRKVAKIRK